MTINVESLNKAFNNLQVWLGLLMAWIIGIILLAIFTPQGETVWIVYLCGGVIIAAMTMRSVVNIGDAL